ncbi:MAG TPA: hypothetical protein VNM90_08735, partial [Haliangium sp.]|nr:hypothetical protein [Haliangium sp.]
MFYTLFQNARHTRACDRTLFNQSGSEFVEGLLEQQMGRVQRKALPGVPTSDDDRSDRRFKSSADFTDDINVDAAHRGLTAIAEQQAAVQAKGKLTEDDPDSIRRIASQGIQDSGSRLPYIAQLQQSFGPEHDL